MPVPLVLNDLSYSRWGLSRYESCACIARLAVALNELRKKRRSCYLLSDIRLGEIALGENLLASFLKESSIRDEVRVLLSFSNKSPYVSFAGLNAELSECFVGADSCKGVLYAQLLSTMAVSFPSSSEWSDAYIDAHLNELIDETNIEERAVKVANISSSEHVAVHGDIFSLYRDCDLRSGADVWFGRVETFPSLRFLDHVGTQLNRYEAGIELDQIVYRLFELELAVAEWDSASQPFPAWRSKVTPESETRRRLCNFVDDQGVEHNYDLHARFTPGAGRIHFRLLPSVRMIEVAYIGEKIIDR